MIGLAFGLAIPFGTGLLSLAFAIAKDGTPFARSFWSA